MKTILILEDNQNHADILKNKLRKIGFKTIILSSPEDAPIALKNNVIDIILTDVYFGKDKIFDLLDIESLSKNYPIIVISGREDEDVIMQSIHAGVLDFINKDNIFSINFNILINKVLRNWTYVKGYHSLENKYNDLIEGFPIGIFYTTIDGRIISFNKKVLNILKYDSIEELKERVYQAISLYKYPEKRDEIVRFALKNPDVWKTYNNVILLDSNGKEVHTSIFVKYNSEENYLEGFIEERNKSEERLNDIQKAESRLNYALKVSEDAVWDWDLITGQTYFSPRYYTMLGYDPYEFEQNIHAWENLTHPEDLKYSAPLLEEIRNGEKDFFEFEFRMKMKNGEWKWLLGKGMAIEKNAENKAVRMVGINVDIDARKHGEISIINEQKRLLTIFESIGDGIIVLNTNDQIEMINRSGVNILYGEDPQYDMVGENIKHYLHAVNKSNITLMDSIELCKKHKRTITLNDSDFYLKNKEYFNEKICFSSLKWEKINIEDAVSPILNEANEVTGIVVAFRDISERLAGEAKAKTLQEQLQQSQKMEAFGQFSGGIAHDFNNILTVIYGYAESLRDLGRKEIEEIIKSCEKASALTKKLLTFGRKQVVSTEVMNISEVIEDLQGMIRRIIEEDIQLDFDLQSKKNVKADKTQIQQVIINFTVNSRDAIKYDDKKEKRIIIRTYDALKHDLIEQQNMGAYKDGFEFNYDEYSVIEVEDTGIGIPKENIHKIFEPFFSTKEKKNGTGLGLSTVYGIVKQNGGAILIDSKERVGTTFLACFPTTKEVKVKKVEHDYSGQKYNGGNKVRILFVEDEPDLIDLVSNFLVNNGCEVECAKNGEEALKAYDAKKHNIIVTDIVMPKVSGTELIHILKERGNDPKVIYTTGYSSDNLVDLGENSEDILLQKPYSLRDLINSIKSLILDK